MTLMKENIEEAKQFVSLADYLKVDAVFFSHLNRWSDDIINNFIVERDGFVFKYFEQGLWNYKSKSNRLIREAIDYAEEINMRVLGDKNKQLLFEEVEDDQHS